VDEAPIMCNLPDYLSHNNTVNTILNKSDVLDKTNGDLTVIEKDEGEHLYVMLFNKETSNFTFKMFTL